MCYPSRSLWPGYAALKIQFPFWLLTVLIVLPFSRMAKAQVHTASGPEIVARQTLVMTKPPEHVPSGTVVDGPILGNGDLGIAMGGPPEEQRFYFGKNDFRSRQASPLSVGGLALAIPGLAGASYRQE